MHRAQLSIVAQKIYSHKKFATSSLNLKFQQFVIKKKYGQPMQQPLAAVKPSRKKKHFNRSLRQSLQDHQSSEGSQSEEIVRLTDTSEVKPRSKRQRSQEVSGMCDLEFTKPGRSSSFIKQSKPDVENLIRVVPDTPVRLNLFADLDKMKLQSSILEQPEEKAMTPQRMFSRDFGSLSYQMITPGIIDEDDEPINSEASSSKSNQKTPSTPEESKVSGRRSF